MFRPPTRRAACLGSTLLSSRSLLYSIFLHHKIPPVGISCGNTPRCMMYTHRRWLFPALAPESIKYLHCKMEDVVFLLKRGSNRKKKSPGCSCAFIDHRTLPEQQQADSQHIFVASQAGQPWPPPADKLSNSPQCTPSSLFLIPQQGPHPTGAGRAGSDAPCAPALELV